MARSIRLPCATDVDVLQLVGVSCSIESETFTLFTNNMLMGVSNGIKWGTSLFLTSSYFNWACLVVWNGGPLPVAIVMGVSEGTMNQYIRPFMERSYQVFLTFWKVLFQVVSLNKIIKSTFEKNILHLVQKINDNPGVSKKSNFRGCEQSNCINWRVNTGVKVQLI